MYNGKTQTATKDNEKEVKPNSSSVDSEKEVSDHTKNDKRYEKPFEDEGACDDDFID